MDIEKLSQLFKGRTPGGNWKNLKGLIEAQNLPMIKTYDGHDARLLKVENCIGGESSIHISPIGIIDDGEGYYARIYVPGSETCAISSELIGYSCQQYYDWLRIAYSAFSNDAFHIVFCELNADNELTIIQPWVNYMKIPITNLECNQKLIDPGDRVFCCLIGNINGCKANAYPVGVISRDVMKAMVYAEWYALWFCRANAMHLSAVGHYLAIDRADAYKNSVVLAFDDFASMVYPKFTDEFKDLPVNYNWPVNTNIMLAIKDYYSLAYDPKHDISDSTEITITLREYIKSR